MKVILNEMIFIIILNLTGILLMISNTIVFITFLKYRQLRTGIYGTVLACVLAEIFIALHAFISPIFFISDKNLENTRFCTIESFIIVFFCLFWCCENTSIMILYFLRKIKHSKLCNYLHLFCIFFSLINTFILFFNHSLGMSSIGTCFIKKDSNYSLIFVLSSFYILFIIAFAYNIWFCKLRDNIKDRSFINGYNSFILFSSFLLGMYFTVLLINYLMDEDIEFLNYLSVIFLILVFLYAIIFRFNIEYITLFFTDESGKNKYKNMIKFIFCSYKLPEFKDIKKRLNVKFIDTNSDFSKNMIYSYVGN